MTSRRNRAKGRRPDERSPVFLEGFSHDDLLSFIEAVPWKYARTMPHMPHEYTQRKWAQELELESEFESAVRFIRENGYKQRFGSKVYTYYDVADEQKVTWQYWTMGAPYERTILINRARVN